MRKRSFEYGLRRVMGEIVSGIVTSAIVDSFLNAGLLPPAYATLFSVLNMLGTISLILAMPFWGTIYLIGWRFGLWIMLQTGLVGVGEAIIYFGVPLAVLIVRILKHI
ncbi:hypothetical protein DRO25_01125 [Candidatus Bathyarchaeota archaeon]|nr:MAG: hypothetical protein DRO25_01125 [Candidatus Bathyarchaeota archaeon]